MIGPTLNPVGTPNGFAHPDVQYVSKPDDHNRKRKGDRVIVYKGGEYSTEIKLLQTPLIERRDDGTFSGKAQCNGSDRRTVTFGDGTTLGTTGLLCGEFDVLAVNCFAFRGEWDYAFARNADLPRSTFRKYTAEQQRQLLALMVPVRWPPAPPSTAAPPRPSHGATGVCAAHAGRAEAAE